MELAQMIRCKAPVKYLVFAIRCESIIESYVEIFIGVFFAVWGEDKV